MDKNELIEEVKAYLVAQGWQTDHTELVIDNIIESFNENALTHGLVDYNEIARNSGVAEAQELDEQTIILLDKIKSTK